MQIRDVYNVCCDDLKNLDDYKMQVQEIFKNILKCDLSEILIGENEIKNADFQKIKTAIKTRKTGVPLQYILGEWDFYGRTFFVGKGVLIPRPETENIIDIIKKNVTNTLDGKKLRIIDLCSGSGCIAITLSKIFDNAEIFALEKSPNAIEYLKKNVEFHNANVTIIEDDVLSPKTKLDEFDIIVSNPPYLTKTDMQELQAEVSFEPEMALFGNDDGLLFYKEITRIWKDRQTVNGKIFFEIGKNQENDVIKILQENNYINICKTTDLYGIIRNINGIRNF